MEPFNGKRRAAVSPPVLDAIEETVRKGRQSPSPRESRGVAELSKLFTRRRVALSSSYLDDPDLSAAYLSYFFPVNLSKIQVLLDELPVDSVVGSAGDSISVLDLGSGPGTGSLAVLDWVRQYCPFRTGNILLHAADFSRVALQQAERLLGAYCRQAGISEALLKTYEIDLETMSVGNRIRQGAPYDLIILANCLNELFMNRADPVTARTSLVEELLPLLKPHGTMMLVEPALRPTSRELHQVRDRLLSKQRCTVYSPCLHEGNCPALIHPNDWCHEERAWEAPAGIQAIDQEVGFIKDALKFSYLLLRTDGRTIAQRGPETFRFVSELRMLKGDTRAWVCNELGRSEIGRLDRARSQTNAAWNECGRGTIVRIDGLKRKDGSMLARIPPEGTIEIVRST